MTSVNQLLSAIDQAPEGPRVAAIFDFDGTLIAGYSAVAFIREQLRRGDLSPRQFAEIARAATNFGLGNLGFSGMMAITGGIRPALISRSRSGLMVVQAAILSPRPCSR